MHCLQNYYEHAPIVNDSSTPQITPAMNTEARHHNHNAKSQNGFYSMETVYFACYPLTGRHQSSNSFVHYRTAQTLFYIYARYLCFEPVQWLKNE